MGAGQGKCYTMHAAQCERVFAVNHAMVDAIKSLTVTNAAPIYNGINRACASQPCHESHTRDPHKPFTVLCAGQCIERKGHAYLLEAFADPRLRHVQLELVGHPPAHLQRQIDELGIQSQISILEEMDQSALLDRMAQSDLFALPSWDEAFGLVYAEALSVGTPVLLTNDAGIHALPYIDESSWVVPPRDSGAVANAILAATKLDSASRAEMTMRMKAWINTRLTWESNAQTLLQPVIQGDHEF